eukprot:Gregarina_sp_Poly_1__6723@NODE_3619_length_974_cov_216_093716_g2305_i0_p2_GENE_NODE_3619_length_974_cov_216_093716_g2305_i0NODE_3619_length_974_cov_216_093716_g2305_i0_p2_ORF_typecomplete_len121_score9_24RNase_PH/PF01138_21/6_2e05PNPase/PF03726_14/0_017_NODE_3619_length_974_cov_216_093716_g2305_i095457
MSAGPEVTTGCSNDETTEKTALSGLSVAEKKFVREGILNDCRTDGRRCDEHRTLQIATGVIPSAFGSARVRNTECDVVCVIKVIPLDHIFFHTSWAGGFMRTQFTESQRRENRCGCSIVG